MSLLFDSPNMCRDCWREQVMDKTYMCLSNFDSVRVMTLNEVRISGCGS